MPRKADGAAAAMRSEGLAAAAPKRAEAVERRAAIVVDVGFGVAVVVVLGPGIKYQGDRNKEKKGSEKATATAVVEVDGGTELVVEGHQSSHSVSRNTSANSDQSLPPNFN